MPLIINGEYTFIHLLLFWPCKTIARGFNCAVCHLCECRRLVELTAEACVPGKPAQTSFVGHSFGFER